MASRSPLIWRDNIPPHETHHLYFEPPPPLEMTAEYLPAPGSDRPQSALTNFGICSNDFSRLTGLND